MTLDQTAERLRRGLRRRATSPQTRPTVSSLGGIHPQCPARRRVRAARRREETRHPGDDAIRPNRGHARARAPRPSRRGESRRARRSGSAPSSRRGAAGARSAEARACPPPPRRTRAPSRNAPRRRKPARTTRRSSPPRLSPRTSPRTAASEQTNTHLRKDHRKMIRETRLTVHEPRRGSRTPPERARRRRCCARARSSTAPPSPPSRRTRASPPPPPPPSVGLQKKSPGLGCFTRVRVLERRGHER